LRVLEVLEDERDVHLRLAGKAIAAAVDAVLADERHRVGDEVERDGEAAPRRTHHRFVALERLLMLVEDRHGFHSTELRYLAGFDGRSSTRLGRLRGSCRNRLTTTSATSSGVIFHSAPFAASPLEKAVATDPGIT